MPTGMRLYQTIDQSQPSKRITCDSHIQLLDQYSQKNQMIRCHAWSRHVPEGCTQGLYEAAINVLALCWSRLPLRQNQLVLERNLHRNTASQLTMEERRVLKRELHRNTASQLTMEARRVLRSRASGSELPRVNCHRGIMARQHITHLESYESD